MVDRVLAGLGHLADLVGVRLADLGRQDVGGPAAEEGRGREEQGHVARGLAIEVSAVGAHDEEQIRHRVEQRAVPRVDGAHARRGAHVVLDVFHRRMDGHHGARRVARDARPHASPNPRPVFAAITFFELHVVTDAARQGAEEGALHRDAPVRMRDRLRRWPISFCRSYPSRRRQPSFASRISPCASVMAMASGELWKAAR